MAAVRLDTPSRAYEHAVHLAATGTIDLSPIAVRRYPLREARSTFEVAATSREVVKFVLEP